MEDGEQMRTHRMGVMRMVHNSISPLRPNLEAVMLGKPVTLWYLSLGVSSVVGKKSF